MSDQIFLKTCAALGHDPIKSNLVDSIDTVDEEIEKWEKLKAVDSEKAEKVLKQ